MKLVVITILERTKLDSITHYLEQNLPISFYTRFSILYFIYENSSLNNDIEHVNDSRCDHNKAIHFNTQLNYHLKLSKAAAELNVPPDLLRTQVFVLINSRYLLKYRTICKLIEVLGNPVKRVSNSTEWNLYRDKDGYEFMMVVYFYTQHLNHCSCKTQAEYIYVNDIILVNTDPLNSDYDKQSSEDKRLSSLLTKVFNDNLLELPQ